MELGTQCVIMYFDVSAIIRHCVVSANVYEHGLFLRIKTTNFQEEAAAFPQFSLF